MLLFRFVAGVLMHATVPVVVDGYIGDGFRGSMRLLWTVWASEYFMYRCLAVLTTRCAERCF